jgi:glycosyltransferase involved in cell wall biosynthesis
LNNSVADISVIIPAYNRANLIGETLRSLLNQRLLHGTLEQPLKAFENWKLEI